MASSCQAQAGELAFHTIMSLWPGVALILKMRALRLGEGQSPLWGPQMQPQLCLTLEIQVPAETGKRKALCYEAPERGDAWGVLRSHQPLKRRALGGCLAVGRCWPGHSTFKGKQGREEGAIIGPDSHGKGFCPPAKAQASSASPSETQGHLITHAEISL